MSQVNLDSIAIDRSLLSPWRSPGAERHSAWSEYFKDILLAAPVSYQTNNKKLNLEHNEVDEVDEVLSGSHPYAGSHIDKS